MLTVLPDPDSPMTPSTSPRSDVEIDAAHRLHLAVADAEADAQVADFDKRRPRGHVASLSRRRGSVRSRIPSPSRLRPKSAIEMNSPDKVSTQGLR